MPTAGLRVNEVAVLAAAVILAAGLGVAGYFVGDGFLRGRLGDRVVTVKGLAERHAKADLALWPIRFTATGNELDAVQNKIDQDTATVRSFLTDHGFASEEVELQRLEVTDLLAQAYRPEDAAESRFIIAQTMLVRTGNVDLVTATSREVGELVKRGVVLTDTGGPSYVFTRLNEIKPSMIAEATEDAREGAAQFAADSDSRVGAIRHANQGVFSILPLDEVAGAMESAQPNKKVRVVSTIDFSLVE